MEREERRRPVKRGSGNAGVVIILLLLLVISAGELVLLLLQKQQLDEISTDAVAVSRQLAEAQTEKEKEELPEQTEPEGITESEALPETQDMTGTEANAGPAEAPNTETASEEAQSGETEENGEDDQEDADEVDYAIVEDVNRIYQDIRYQQFAKENDPYDTKQYTYSFLYSYPTDVVFLGDSLTERCSWNEMFPDLRVLNRGIGGDTVNGVLVRLDTVMKTQPKKIFLMVGVNNLMNGNEVDQIIEDYSVLLDELQEIQEEDGCKIYVESILPAGAALKNASRVILDGREVNAAVREMCEDRDITYIDLTDKFSNEDLGLRNEYDYDGVHINATGYRVLRDILEEYVYEDVE